MSAKKAPQDLEDLGKRLDSARKRITPPRQVAGESLGRGTRLALELVSGVIVGGAIGFALDKALGTKPWLMLALFSLGLAAGYRNLLRAVEAERVQGEARREEENGDKAPTSPGAQEKGEGR